MSDVAEVISLLIKSGVDPDLVGRAAALMSDSKQENDEELLTKRQIRNRKYYQKTKKETVLKTSEKRLKTSESVLKRLNSDDSVLKTSESVLKRLNSDGEGVKEKSPHTPLKENNTPLVVPPKAKQHDEKSGAKQKCVTKGSRLIPVGSDPEDWQCPADWIDWAFQNGCPDPHLQARKFVDYWAGRSGQKAVKVDWKATWRNWIRSDYSSQASQVTHSALDNQRAQCRIWLRDRKSWERKWGPEPDQPGCKIPQSVLSEFNIERVVA